MFTQKHYIKIAETLKDGIRFISNEERTWHHKIVDNFVQMFKNDNERFSIDKFISAVYGKEGAK